MDKKNEREEGELKFDAADCFDYRIPSRILDRLYLGSIALTFANHIQAHRITAVLSVLTRKPMSFHHCKGVQYHLVQVDDDEQADLLSHLEKTTQLLDEWLNGQGLTVLVHCQMGVSRSSTVVIAYLMWHLHKSYDEVLKYVKKIRPVASPNRGFVRQLRLWGELKHRLSLTDKWYRRYTFLTIVNSMQKQQNGLVALDDELKERIGALARADNVTTTTINDDDNNLMCPVYRCRRCRCQLFTEVQLLHADPLAYFVYILPWMITGDCPYLRQSGKITCPKCAGKLGRFCWSPPVRKVHFMEEETSSSQGVNLLVPMVFQMTKSAIDVGQSKQRVVNNIPRSSQPNLRSPSTSKQ